MLWVYQFLGKPWSRDGQGPDSFNCWNLVRAVHRVRFGRVLPVFDPDEWSVIAYARTFGGPAADEELRTNWIRVDKPQEGDIVFLGRASRPSHIGVWVGNGYTGKVLHCVEPDGKGQGGISGVVAQSVPSLRQHGWGLVEFYRHKEMQCAE